MPMIMAPRLARGRGPSPRASRCTASARPHEDRLADQEMADVEFDDLRQRRDRLGGLDNRARGRHGPRGRACRASLRAVADAPPLGLGRRRRRPRRARRTRRRCGSRSPARRRAAAASICAGSAAMNSETRMPASRSSATAGASCVALAGDIEPALGGALLAPLRHEAGGVRPGLAARSRTISSVAAISKLSGLAISRLQPRDVVVADVAAILAQMRGDAVGAGLDRELGRAHRIGMPPAARIADGRDVIDVDAEAKMGDRRHVIDLSRVHRSTRASRRSPARPSRPRPSPATAR